MASLLLLTDDAATGFRNVGRNRVEQRPIPHPDADDGAELRAWLSAHHRRRPLRVLIDTAVEAFHCEARPPVRGLDAHRLRRRVAARHFAPDEPRFTRYQGTGQLLVAGIADSAWLDPWLRVIADAGVPVFGVASFAIMIERSLRSLGLHREPGLLLVTRQSAGKVRQSFYAKGRLQVSRLIAAEGETPAAHGAHLSRELERMHTYLQRRNESALPPRSVVIDPVAADAEFVRNLQHVDADDVMTPRIVATQLRIHCAPSVPDDCASLFAQVGLGARRHANHYASSTAMLMIRVRSACSGLHVVSMAMLVAAAVIVSSAADRQLPASGEPTAGSSTPVETRGSEPMAALPARIPGGIVAPVERWLIDGILPTRPGPAGTGLADAMVTLAALIDNHPDIRPAVFHWRVAHGMTESGSSIRLAGTVEGDAAAGFAGLLADLQSSDGLVATEVLRRPDGMRQPERGDLGTAVTAAGDPRFDLRLHLAEPGR